jgi:hypothetical protein
VEASQAGLSGGDAGQGEGGEAQAQEQQGPDVSALAEQLSGLTQGMDGLREYLQSEPWRAPEPEGGEPEGEEPMDLGFLDTGDPQYNAELAQGLQALIDQRAQQVAQQQVGPLQQEVEQQREHWVEYKANQLTQEFPELGEEETATRVIQFSRQRAEALGQPELANSPDFWRESYLLGRAMQMMQEEAQAGQEPVAHLEGGGGAGAGQAQQVNPVDLIMNRGDGELGARVLNFGS